MDRELFEQMYQGQAAWTSGGLKPAINQVGRGGQDPWQCSRRWLAAPAKTLVLGRPRPRELGTRLRAGCHRTGQGQAAQRGIDAHFLVGNALELNKLGRRFDTVIDCGLFHTFSDERPPGIRHGTW